MAKVVTWSEGKVFFDNPVVARDSEGRTVATVRLRVNDRRTTRAHLVFIDYEWRITELGAGTPKAVERLLLDHVRVAHNTVRR